MHKLYNTVTLIAAIIGSFLGFFLGGIDGFLYALICFVAIDYFTGVLVAMCNRKISSKIGFNGIAKKVMLFALVGVANIIDINILGEISVVRTAVIFFYLSNEGISILENATELGMPVPYKLKQTLEQIKNNKK